MADLTRRGFLNNLAGLSMLAVPGLSAALTKPAATMMDDTITFEIKFTGPLGFIPYGDYFQIYAPFTTFEHYPVISSDADELLLNDAADYVFDQPSPAMSSLVKQNPPFLRDAHDPFDYAKKNCRIGITVPRPDIIKGINIVKDVNVDGSPKTLPAGVRFIYNGIPKNKPPIFKNSTVTFDPQFKKDDPIWELNIRLIPESILDLCHRAAEVSFIETAKLCSVSQVPTLNYGEPAHCHVPVGPKHALMDSMIDRSRLRGPGSDCQTLPILINPI